MKIQSNTGWIMLEEKWEERDKILFGEADSRKYAGGARPFEKVSLSVIKELLEKGFIDPEDSQNGSPTAAEFIEFADEADVKYSFHGYATAPDRYDVRITIEGIEADEDITMEELIRFTSFARHADDFYADETGLYCWWD